MSSTFLAGKVPYLPSPLLARETQWSFAGRDSTPMMTTFWHAWDESGRSEACGDTKLSGWAGCSCAAVAVIWMGREDEVTSYFRISAVRSSSCCCRGTLSRDRACQTCDRDRDSHRRKCPGDALVSTHPVKVLSIEQRNDKPTSHPHYSLRWPPKDA